MTTETRHIITKISMVTCHLIQVRQTLATATHHLTAIPTQISTTTVIAIFSRKMVITKTTVWIVEKIIHTRIECLANLSFKKKIIPSAHATEIMGSKIMTTTIMGHSEISIDLINIHNFYLKTSQTKEVRIKIIIKIIIKICNVHYLLIWQN